MSTDRHDSGGMAALTLHPDRLLPADPTTRAIARELYAGVSGAPILSPHGHVEASLLLEDEPFRDPASLLITPDHYVKRLLHANGVGLERLGVGLDEPTEDESRAIWRTLCSHWPLFRTRVERRLPALSSFRGQRPAHETRWAAVGKRVMSTPISARITWLSQNTSAPICITGIRRYPPVRGMRSGFGMITG